MMIDQRDLIRDRRFIPSLRTKLCGYEADAISSESERITIALLQNEENQCTHRDRVVNVTLHVWECSFLSDVAMMIDQRDLIRDRRFIPSLRTKLCGYEADAISSERQRESDRKKISPEKAGKSKCTHKELQTHGTPRSQNSTPTSFTSVSRGAAVSFMSNEAHHLDEVATEKQLSSVRG